MSLGNKALSILKTLAPTVATAVGGPFAGLALSTIAKKFGVDKDQIENVILGGDPENLAKLRQADKDFKVAMRELGIKEDELTVRSQESARELAKVKGFVPHIVLSVIFILGYFFLLSLLISGQWFPPGGTEELLAGLIGVMTAMVIKIGDFWFGSSFGSKQKDQALANSKPA